MDGLSKRVNQLMQSPDFLRLQSLRSQSNLFEIVAASHTEMWHSAFIKWLLDPQSSVGLGTFPLKRFLYMVIAEGVYAEDGTQLSLNLAEIEDEEFLKLNQMTFHTEYSIKDPDGRIDILGMNEIVRVTIENKINSKENADQTDRYYEYLSKNAENVIFDIMVYLSPDDSKIPKCKEFIQVTYQSLCDFVLKPCLNHPGLLPENQFLINQYISNLKKPTRGGKVMAQPNKDLCISIYNSYKDVLDEIFLAVKDEIPLPASRKKVDRVTTYSTTITELVNKKIISVQDILVGKYNNKFYEASLVKDNDKVLIVYQDVYYKSPSLAAQAITGYNINGWVFWKVKSKDESLSKLREELD